MRLIKLWVCMMLLIAIAPAKAQVGIGTTTPAAAAELDVNSTTKGFLPPRMTLLQREAIANPVAGLMIYCNDCGSKGQIQFYDGTDWVDMIGGTPTLPVNYQLGNDIDGEATEDESGWSVALSADGSRLAIGARFNDEIGSKSGQVRMYSWNGTNWTQLGNDIDGEATGDESGHSVSISADGNRVAIGAIRNDGNGATAGHVRVYNWNGTDWVQQGTDIDGEAAQDQSGYAVSLSSDGNRLAIGAQFNDGAGTSSGHVRIYNWNGTAWVQQGADIDGEAFNDRSGYSVSLSADGSRMAIGAPFNDGTDVDAGHVRIFNWNGTSWVQLGADIDGSAYNDQSGYTVSLSADGNRVAIGAPNYGSGAFTNGRARVYCWNGTAWLQMGTDIDGEAFADYSGWSVSLSADGSRVAIGAPQNDGNGGNAGQVRIYGWNGTSWYKLSVDIDGEAASDLSGSAVAISADGKRVAIGAPGNDGSASGAGHVRVYDFQ